MDANIIIDSATVENNVIKDITFKGDWELDLQGGEITYLPKYNETIPFPVDTFVPDLVRYSEGEGTEEEAGVKFSKPSKFGYNVRVRVRYLTGEFAEKVNVGEEAVIKVYRPASERARKTVTIFLFTEDWAHLVGRILVTYKS